MEEGKVSIINMNQKHLDYIEHQKIKTTNPKKIKKWLNEEWGLKLNGFKIIFSQYIHLFDTSGKCVGLGARTGQEIAALQELGFKDSIGVDLVSFEPYTIEADFHNLPFKDNSVSFIYTNAVDHVRDPRIWSYEINRILRTGGYVLMNCQINMGQDEYAVFHFSNTLKELIEPYFRDYKVIVNKGISQNVHAMNWEILLQK
jgi:SAM-dependent methyltransferase